jgi:hypothetical protein
MSDIALQSDPWFRAFPRDADGYTLFPTEGAVIISNTGDVRDFKSAQQICQQTGRSAILFARGQRFTADQINDDVRTNGVSPRQPFVIGATPDVSNAMPILLGGFGIGDAHLPATQNIVICDLDFYGDSRDPAADNFTTAGAVAAQSQQNALRMDAGNGGANLWIEGCRVRCFQSGISLESVAPFSSVIVRRNVIDHCWASHFGLYTAGLTDVLIDENWMDHNGWMAGQSPKTILNHNGYLQTSSDPDPQFRVQHNIFARGSCFGCQQRPGGLNLNNLYIGNPMAFLLEARDSVARNCVVTGAGFNLSIAGQTRGDGFLSDFCTSVLIDTCIFTDKLDAINNNSAISINCVQDNTNANVPTVVKMQNTIVHNWSGPSVYISGQPGGMTYDNCDLPGMTAPGINMNPQYVDPDRTLQSYCESIGLDHSTEFLAAMVTQRRGNYRRVLTAMDVNNYIREGFTKR